MRVSTGWIMTGVSVGLLCCFGAAQHTPYNGALPLAEIIEAMEKTQARTRPHVSYQVIREYRLSGANDSSANSEVVAEVDFRPPASKAYRIQNSLGSKRGQQVVRRVLDEEIESSSTSNQAGALLSRENYDFTYIGEVTLDSQLCYLLGLKPKRREENLISGRVWIDQHSFLMRQIEGEVAKIPSWWLKKIRVKLQFADIDGAWLQSQMEAVADVRIFGPHTLTSRVLDYRPADEVASTRPRIRSLDRKP
jgi:hypothetical protein